jgi:hypothetical protein
LRPEGIGHRSLASNRRMSPGGGRIAPRQPSRAERRMDCSLIHSSPEQAFAPQRPFPYGAPMDGDRISNARARIEQAVSRIEAAVSRPVPAVDNSAAVKYEALRREAGSALADLDRLIATLEA